MLQDLVYKYNYGAHVRCVNMLLTRGQHGTDTCHVLVENMLLI